MTLQNKTQRLSTQMAITRNRLSGWKNPKCQSSQVTSGNSRFSKRTSNIWQRHDNSKRDSITILRASLNGKPLELIRGIGQDYYAAWEHLESIYGDPRFVADTIMQDIARFKPLRDEEDARFCDLVHLLRRSFNTLSEVGRQNDMDNNHISAIIEQKVCSDDRKVWSHFLETTKCHATLEALMSRVTSEMKSRMRATALLRSSKHLNVNQVSAFEEKGAVNHKCWTSVRNLRQCPPATI